MPDDIQGRFITIWSPETGPANAQESAQGRIDGLLDGVALFQLFPLTGVGIGNFIANRVNLLNGPPLQAHNLLGQILGETGMIGMIGFSVVVIAAFVGCTQIRFKNSDQGSIFYVFDQLSLACRDALLLLLVLGLFGHNLLRFNWYLITIIVEIAIVFYPKKELYKISPHLKL